MSSRATPSGDVFDVHECDGYKCHTMQAELEAGPPVKAIADLTDDALVLLGQQVRLERLHRLNSWQNCTVCEKRFAARAKALYCSGRCRTAAYRKRLQASKEVQG